jgi:nitrogen fixation protein
VSVQKKRDWKGSILLASSYALCLTRLFGAT